MILILWPTSDTLWKWLESSATLKFQVWDSPNNSKNLPSWCINYKLVRNGKFWPHTLLRLFAHMPCFPEHFCQGLLLANKMKVERWEVFFCKRMWHGQNLEPATLPQMCCPADDETSDHVKLGYCPLCTASRIFHVNHRWGQQRGIALSLPLHLAWYTKCLGYMWMANKCVHNGHH